MNRTDVTRSGLKNERPEREALTGAALGRKRSRPGVVVPPAEFKSYYGLPVINGPVWEARDIAGYLWLGGIAGASSVIAAGAQATRRPHMAKAAKLTSAGAAALSLAALVHDLGRPSRFLNMLRVFKPTSPMSVGSWILAGYAPSAFVAAATSVTGTAPLIGAAATVGAATLGPAVASYTGALLASTAVPAWHGAYKNLSFLFVSSGASAAGGLALVTSRLSENAPARRLAVAGGTAELVVAKLLEKQLHANVVTAYRSGRAGALLRASRGLTIGGVAGTVLFGRRSRLVAMVSGAALAAGSACTRFGVFAAGQQSAADPIATIAPQAERVSGMTAA